MVPLAKHQVRAAPMVGNNSARIFGFVPLWHLTTSPATWCVGPKQHAGHRCAPMTGQKKTRFRNKQISLVTLHFLLQLQVQMRRSTSHAYCCTALWMTSCSPPSGAKNFAAAALCHRLKRWDVMFPCHFQLGLASYCDAAAQMAHPSPHSPWRFSGRS